MKVNFFVLFAIPPVRRTMRALVLSLLITSAACGGDHRELAEEPLFLPREYLSDFYSSSEPLIVTPRPRRTIWTQVSPSTSTSSVAENEPPSKTAETSFSPEVM